MNISITISGIDAATAGEVSDLLGTLGSTRPVGTTVPVTPVTPTTSIMPVAPVTPTTSIMPVAPVTPATSFVDDNATALPVAPMTSETSETPETPETPATTSLDSKGVPWDARIHTANKGQKQDGTWKRKPRVDGAVYDAVLAEITNMSQTAPAATTNVDPVTVVTQPIADTTTGMAPAAPPVAPAAQIEEATNKVQDIIRRFMTLNVRIGDAGALCAQVMTYAGIRDGNINFLREYPDDGDHIIYIEYVLAGLEKATDLPTATRIFGDLCPPR